VNIAKQTHTASTRQSTVCAMMSGSYNSPSYKQKKYREILQTA